MNVKLDCGHSFEHVEIFASANWKKLSIFSFFFYGQIYHKL